MADGNGNGSARIFWTWAGPITMAVCMAAVGFIVASGRADYERLDQRTDRLEEGRTVLVERLSRIETTADATRGDVQQIRHLLELRQSGTLMENTR